MNIEILYQKFLECSNITTDSRLVSQNSIFFALKGENFNGNQYAKKALENGCAYAIIDDPGYEIDSRCIMVDNVLETLQKLSSFHRTQLNIPIIAITGTNGKTTSKELISAVLGKKYNIAFTKGNLNNHIGVPLTLLSMNKDTQIGIVEMGANHPYEIKQLCEIADPNFGVITNIGKAHLEGFGSYENVVKTKKELYDYIKNVDGKVFYNAKNSLLQELVLEIGLNSNPFGTDTAIVQGRFLPSNPFVRLHLTIANKVVELNTHLVGNYNLENILLSVAIGHYFDVKNEDIISAIENYIPQNNRSQFIQTKRNHLILDAYNANPTSVEAAINNFCGLELKNKWVILGDMLELGIDSQNEHQKIIDLIIDQGLDDVILVGPIYSAMKVPAKMLQFKDVNELKTWVDSNNISNSNVLIKGSRGIQLEKIVDNL